MTDQEIRKAAETARKIASEVGPMHAYWELIFDAEMILAGTPTTRPREWIEKELGTINRAYRTFTP